MNECSDNVNIVKSSLIVSIKDATSSDSESNFTNMSSDDAHASTSMKIDNDEKVLEINLNTKLNRVDRKIKKINKKMSKKHENTFNLERIVNYDKNVLPLPTHSVSRYLHASDLAGFERESLTHVEWMDGNGLDMDKNADITLSQLSGLKSKPEITVPSSMVQDRKLHSPEQNKISFPKSFFNYFKNSVDTEFVKARAAYFLDSLTGMTGYIREKPDLDFNTVIFHDKGIEGCCNKPPPSKNKCDKYKENLENKHFLDNLPRTGLNEKVASWLYGTSTDCMDFNKKVEKINTDSVSASEDYISEYRGHQGLEWKELPYLDDGEFTILSILGLTIFMLFMFFVPTIGGCAMGILAFFLILGKKVLPYYFHLLVKIGYKLESIFTAIESLILSPGLRRLFNFHEGRRIRSKILYSMYSLIDWVEFLPPLLNRKLRPSIIFSNQLRRLPIHFIKMGNKRGGKNRYLAKRITSG